MTDHERCSELLRERAAGVLSGEDARWVDDHLSTCADCSEELVALRSLMTAEPEPMTDLERASLHRSVAELTRDRRSEEVIPQTSDWRRRAAPLLGAAALIALLLGAATQLDLGGGDVETAATAPADRDGGKESRTQADRGGDPLAAPNSVRAGGVEAAEDSAGGAFKKGPQPIFDRVGGSLSPNDLEQRAVHGQPFTSFSRSYTGRDAHRLQRILLTDLARQAPSAGVAGDVRRCARTIIEAGTDYRYLPAYARLAKIRGRDSLLVGFVYTLQEKAPNSPLNKFQLWAWQRPGCNNVILYEKGPIRP